MQRKMEKDQPVKKKTPGLNKSTNCLSSSNTQTVSDNFKRGIKRDSLNTAEKSLINNRNFSTNVTTGNLTKDGTLDNYQVSNQENMLLNLNECGQEEINEIIRKNAEARRQYSKTYAEQSYTPLTNKEKKKFLEDFGENSDKRLKLYSELFKEIKTQISFISNNISSTYNDKQENRSLSKIKTTKNYNISGNMNNIDEEDVSEFSLEIDSGNREINYLKITNANNATLSSQAASKVKLRTLRSKNIIKIDNPYSVISTKGNDFDCNVEDEVFKEICLPYMEYQSNNIQNLDISSGIKSYSHSASEKNFFKSVGSSDRKYSNFVSNTLGPCLKPIPSIDSNRNLLEKNILPPLNTNKHKKERHKQNALLSSFLDAKMELQTNNLNNFCDSYSVNNCENDNKSHNSHLLNYNNNIISSYSNLNEEDLKLNMATKESNEKKSKCQIF